MKYSITNQLNPEHLSMLKELIGVKIKKIYLEEVGEFELSVIINSDIGERVFKNIPTVELDGDDYPKFSISVANEGMQNYKELIINEKIQSISIFRDEATWQINNNNWVINADIGIKIKLEDRELVLLAYDSMAGFIKFIDSSYNVGDKSKVFEEYWSMKTDKIDSLKRMELSLIVSN
jgi:hypothetical protein